MAATLRDRHYPSLSVTCEIFAGEHHQTSVPLNISRSLPRLYDIPRLERQLRAAALWGRA